ncbi:MAG: lysophospholipase [Elusimicrobiota bacterium]|jgi:dienelactone hydrolase|nr:lysophospholipase [Elusimicrobiota bacterium]
MKRFLTFLIICFAPAAYAQQAAQTPAPQSAPAPIAEEEGSVTITTEDGWEIKAIYAQAQPPEGQDAPPAAGKAVIFLHELMGGKNDFKNLAKKLNQFGFTTLAVDLRGHGGSVNLGEQSAFKKTGTDNEFNQMTRDVTAAIEYLAKNGFAAPDVFLIGEGLGANVAARSIIFNPDIAGLALLTPTLKSRDVLTMTGIKVNTKPVFIAVSSADRKNMMEASFIRNAAFLASGQGKVTFLTAYDRRGAAMVERYLADDLIQWLNYPQLPEVLPDIPPDVTLTQPQPADAQPPAQLAPPSVLF